MFRYLGVCVCCTVAEEELKLFFKVDSLGSSCGEKSSDGI